MFGEEENSKCVLCLNGNTSTMLECRNCRQIFHRSCVKFTSNLNPGNWNCRLCRKKQSASVSCNSRKRNEPNDESPIQDANASDVVSRSIQRVAEDNDHQNDIKTTAANVAVITESSEQEDYQNVDAKEIINSIIPENYQLANDEIRSNCKSIEKTLKMRSKRGSTKLSTKTSQSRKELMLNKLEEARELQMKRDREYLDEKYRILQEEEEESLNSSIDSGTREEMITSWVSKLEHVELHNEEIPKKMIHEKVTVDRNTPVTSTFDHSKNRILFTESESKMNIQATMSNRFRDCESNTRTTTNNRKNTSLAPVIKPSTSTYPGRSSEMQANIMKSARTQDLVSMNHNVKPSSSLPWMSARNQTQFRNSASFHEDPPQGDDINDPIGLSMRQIAVRQVISKDLPPFNGDPTEWPMFISSYIRSTRTCNYSNEENLVRLQRCLKGKALLAVRSKLIYPETVPNVLATLRMLFGRPQIVLQMLIEQIRKEPPINPEKLETVVELSLSVQHLCATMEATDLVDHLNNPLLLQELVEKLPGTLKLNWATHSMACANVNLSTFNQWLYQLADAAGSVVTFKPIVPVTSKRNSDIGSRFVHAAHVQPETSSTAKPALIQRHTNENCSICNTNKHRVPDCEKFMNMGKKERWETMRSCRLCRKCLGYHQVTKCKSFKECRVNGCTYKHHPLLHDPDVHSPASAYKDIVATTIAPLVHATMTKKLLFRIVPVVLYGNRCCVSTYAFLDEGSSLTLIDEEIAKSLELEGPEQDLQLKWTGNTTRLEKRSKTVSLEISGVMSKSSKYRINDVRTVTTLDLPMQTVDLDYMRSRYKHLQGLPIHEYTNVQPRILIGIQHWQLGKPSRICEGNWGEPIAVSTPLGWILFGSYHHVAAEDRKIVHHNLHYTSMSDDDLHRQVNDFFTTENFGVKCPNNVPESKEDLRAKEIMQATTKRVGNKYVTGLLWRFDHVELPNSLPLATRRFMSLERKMNSNPMLALELKKQMNHYVKERYVRKLSPEEAKWSNSRAWYLPIFTVTNPNKPGKTRIVWDAAAEVNGISLNSVLLKGPDYLSPLLDILYRFREQPIAITADIKEMFHQIGVIEEDQSSQRFLWRDDKNEKPDVYVMTVMTFGATCSPSCAQYIKNINAQRFENNNKRAYFAIRHNHYVDDWLDGFESEEEAIDVAKQVIQIHSSGGFHIRNFISNSNRVLESLDTTLNERIKDLNMSGENQCSETAKVLGMWWSTTDDCFYFKLNFNRLDPDIMTGVRKPTKREVLRVIMMVFDPLGLIAHIVVYAKILMRDIWKSGVGWDQEISIELNNRWNNWTSLLPKLCDIKIPRWYMTKRADSIELHVFVDASENAFAAVAYFRVETSDGIICRLIGAKTKVAPQSAMTIPRLELQAAVLGTRLATTICKAHNIQPIRKQFWSDSTDVLAWIGSQHKRYRQFVAFRISEILETSCEKDWRWVPSKHNVADEATKWKSQPSVIRDSRWLHGPEFLTQSVQNWPVSKNFEITSSDEELRPNMSHFLSAQLNLVPDVSRFSIWKRLLCSTAWALRFFYQAKKYPIEKGALTNDEILAAEYEIYRMVQKECYSPTVHHLKTSMNEALEKTDVLYKLTPFLDDKLVLRVRGRANRITAVMYDAVNPIILPSYHPVTKLIVSYYHSKYHHNNHETVVNEIRQKFAIQCLRVVLKRVRLDCQRCKIEHAKPIPPRMGDHPIARVAAYTPPFSYVGIDYFGPVEVVHGRKTEKRWVALFTCLTVRAVHLEIVHNLTKTSCMMAIRNFIARRGTPIEIRTDNGTNFRGACNELRRFYHSLKVDDYKTHFQEIKWVFNPPSAPHMGGCWERLVRSVKKCIDASMPQRKPDDETLRCFLMEAEAVVNSRPLTYIPIDPEEEEALTPNHFLIGSSSGKKPFSKFNCEVNTLVRNYELSQRMADYFWRRWLREYLPDLTRTTKWFQNVKKLEVGDVVVIVDEKNRNSWKNGLIIDTVSGGKSGQVRQVTVKTNDGIYVRPATKVALLDVAHKKDVKLNSHN